MLRSIDHTLQTEKLVSMHTMLAGLFEPTDLTIATVADIGVDAKKQSSFSPGTGSMPASWVLCQVMDAKIQFRTVLRTIGFPKSSASPLGRQSFGIRCSGSLNHTFVRVLLRIATPQLQTLDPRIVEPSLNM